MNRILVTGGAGFIGSHLIDRLVATGRDVTVIDNFDAFYSREEKQRNLQPHLQLDRIRLIEADIVNDNLNDRLGSESFDAIVHLAALAGVRPSLERPIEYQRVNVLGTTQLLEYARRRTVRQFVFASSSSVYGNNSDFPWREDSSAPSPISPYAASKLAGEALGRVYSALFGIRFIALRFFTVYGPRQRPDLAIRRFAQSILADRPIALFGDGSSTRDYTYVDDIVDGIMAAISYQQSSFEAINLGNHRDIGLLQLVREIELALGRRATIQWLPAQPGDVERTCASITKAQALLHYDPQVSLQRGLQKFCEWLRPLVIK
ncbi:MAG: GDP-mannose 4,6-dehydratase [Pirellulales bacterium]|nr:GDP-mannose 4,6-dehydratase [Pirellulales bacterium]